MSECACVYMPYDGEPIELETTRQLRARKPHKCIECGDTIATGDTYECVKGMCEGKWECYRTCLTCVEIRSALCCDGWIFGGLWDAIGEHIDEGGNPIACLNELETVAAKAALARFVRQHLELPS